MRILLIAATIAFITAGIYGIMDVSRDVKNGTFIQYEDEEKIALTSFASDAKGIFKSAVTSSVEKKKSAFDARILKKVLTLSLNDLNISDFSRGEPPMYYESMMIETLGTPDSVKSADVVTAIKDTVAALTEKTKENVKKEERKVSLKLFSRSKPRLYVKETVAVQNDTTKN